MRFALAAALVLATGAAHAEWTVVAAVDPMTDQRSPVAAVYARDNPAVALRVACQNGAPIPDLLFAAPIGKGTMGANYRFDDGPVQIREAHISTSGRELWLWFNEPHRTKQIRAAKRLRVQVFLRYEDSLFLDFDLTGAAAALAQVSCSGSKR